MNCTVISECIHFIAGAPSNFTVTADITCSSDSGVDIIIIPDSNDNTFTVALTIEQLSSCDTVSGSLPGQQTQAG